jgi:glycosyltransferase involved in cell wall biosynthesis
MSASVGFDRLGSIGRASLVERPTITVAIPTMNGARHIAETLRGILRQSGVAFDLVVSDDRSDDDTLAQVAAIAGDRARICVNSERLGLAGNWNCCVALSQTACVAIVHQDDVLLPGHLAAHVDAFRLDPAVGLVSSASVVIDDDGRDVPHESVGRGGLGPVDRIFSPGEALAGMAAENPLRCSAVSLRVAAHTAAGGFNARLRYIVDWDLWLRVARAWSVAWRARPGVAVRWHAGSETHRFRTGTLDLEETERLIDELHLELGSRGALPDSVRPRARRKLARAYLNRAYGASCQSDAPLARRCLGRAVRLWPGVLSAIVTDPRLAARLVTATLTPRSSARTASRKS